jgi:hypothetical protein
MRVACITCGVKGLTTSPLLGTSRRASWKTLAWVFPPPSGLPLLLYINWMSTAHNLPVPAQPHDILYEMQWRNNRCMIIEIPICRARACSAWWIAAGMSFALNSTATIGELPQNHMSILAVMERRNELKIPKIHSRKTFHSDFASLLAQARRFLHSSRLPYYEYTYIRIHMQYRECVWEKWKQRHVSAHQM